MWEGLALFRRPLPGFVSRWASSLQEVSLNPSWLDVEMGCADCLHSCGRRKIDLSLCVKSLVFDMWSVHIIKSAASRLSRFVLSQGPSHEAAYRARSISRLESHAFMSSAEDEQRTLRRGGANVPLTLEPGRQQFRGTLDAPERGARYHWSSSWAFINR